MKTVNILVRWAAAHPGQDRRLPGVVTHSTLASCGSIQGGDQSNVAPGSLSTGSPASRTPLLLKREDGSMYSQAYVRAR